MTTPNLSPEAQRAAEQAQNAALTARGLCRWCGSTPVYPGSWWCVECNAHAGIEE